jgi:ferredoxin
VKTSRIFASTNAAALDAVASGMIGYDPADIATLICAKDRQMIDDYDKIQILGNIEPVPFKHVNKEALNREYRRDSVFVTGTYVYPMIDESKCTGCGCCVPICPVNAISLVSGQALVEEQRCINCYRCFYECPENAIGDTAPALNKFMRMGRKILRL